MTLIDKAKDDLRERLAGALLVKLHYEEDWPDQFRHELIKVVKLLARDAPKQFVETAAVDAVDWVIEQEWLEERLKVRNGKRDTVYPLSKEGRRIAEILARNYEGPHLLVSFVKDSEVVNNLLRGWEFSEYG